MFFGTLQADGLAAMGFLAFAAACWRLRISFDVSLLAGIALIICAASLFALNQPEVGVFLSTLAYGFLAVAVCLSIAARLTRPAPHQSLPHPADSSQSSPK